VDVARRPRQWPVRLTVWLDLRIVLSTSSLRGVGVQAEESRIDCSSDRLPDDARTTAFRMLFDGQPVGLDALAARLGVDAARAGAAVAQLECDGLVRRDADGRLVGSYGLSVVPSKDVLHLPDRQLWTWCIKTALGILAGVGRGG